MNFHHHHVHMMKGVVQRYDPMYRNMTPSFIPIHNNNNDTNTNKKEQQQYYDDIILLSKRTKMLKEIQKDLGRHLPTTDSSNNIHTNNNNSSNWISRMPRPIIITLRSFDDIATLRYFDDTVDL